MLNRKRIASLLLCLGFVLAIAVSSACIAHEAGHDCSGEDCPICRIIAINLQLLHALGLVLTALAVLFAAAKAKRALRAVERLCLPVFGTLVSWKIRLND